MPGDRPESLRDAYARSESVEGWVWYGIAMFVWVVIPLTLS